MFLLIFLFFCVKINNKYLFVSKCSYHHGLILCRRMRDEALLDESVRHRDLAEGHPEGPAPHLETLDVEHGGLVLGEQQHNVLPG